MHNVLNKRKLTSENIIKLRELSLKMQLEMDSENPIYDVYNQISNLVNKNVDQLCDSEKIKFYEKICNQIKKLLNSVKI